MKSVLLSVIIVVGCLMAVQQPAYGSTAILDKSVKLYSEGKYDSTILVVRKYLRTYGKDALSERLVPLVTEALVRRGDYRSAQRLITMYRIKFTNSPFLPRLWYIEGVILAKEEKYPSAIAAFSMAMKQGVTPLIDSLIFRNTEKIGKHLTSEEFTQLSQRSIHNDLQEILRYYEIEKLVSLGQFVMAQSRADDFRADYPRSRYDGALRTLASRAKEGQKGVIQIGLLAPVSGNEGEIGKSVVQGAQLAIERLQPQNGQVVKSIVLDTKGNMIETARKTSELLNQHKVSLIVGPVLSQTATVTAAMLVGKKAIMLSPTATDEGIADLSQNCYQMNVTIGVLGRKIARYAIENLAIKDFAIMAPRTAYGEILANSFKDELLKRNVELVAEVYFEEGGNDFTAQFKGLRSKLLARHLERLTADRGVEFSGVVSRSDSIRYLDSTLSVGGLFIPADADDVVMLAPQVFFNRIKTQMLGSNGWHTQKVIDDGKRYVGNAMIATSFDVDESGKVWLDFKKAYKNRYNTDPDRIAALGYDAAALIMRAVRESGGDDPEKVGEQLLKTDKYSGLSGVVTFDRTSRANSEAAVYKITESGFVRVQ